MGRFRKLHVSLPVRDSSGGGEGQGFWEGKVNHLIKERSISFATLIWLQVSPPSYGWCLSQ